MSKHFSLYYAKTNMLLVENELICDENILDYVMHRQMTKVIRAKTLFN